MISEQKPDLWEPPCIIEGVPFEDYLAIEAASSHALGTILEKSPKHVKEEPDKPSAPKDLGSVVHALILEPDKADEQIVVKPDGACKGSNEGKRVLLDWLMETTGVSSSAGTGLAEGKMLSAQIAELEPMLAETGVTVCTSAQYDNAQRMRDNVFAKDIGKVLFAAGRAEVTMMAIDPRTGVLCKGRIDWLPEGHEVILDLKSAASAAYAEFARAAGRYGYHRQAAFYRWLYSLVTGLPPFPFLHVVVESEPPFDCAFYELDEAAIQGGEKIVRRALEIWKLCEESGYWPGIGYDFGLGEYAIQPLSLPRWAL